MSTERKGDFRIYIIWCFFFGCIITGSLFLGLYIILPPSNANARYSSAGFVLVGIPWVFWLLTYFYRTCFKRSDESQIHESSSSFFNKVPSSSHNSNYSQAAGVSPNAGVPAVAHSLNNGGGGGGGGSRHVQFGMVKVMGNGESNVGGGDTQIDREAMAKQAGISLDDSDEEGDRREGYRVSSGDSSCAESEMPLRLTVS